MSKLFEKTFFLPRANRMIAIVNSSPLIYLGKLGLLRLLEEFFDRVATVPAVKDEVLEATAPEYATLVEAFSTWLDVIDETKTSLSKKLHEMGLHQGEVDVLDLAHKMNEGNEDTVIVIDDLAARDIARALGLRLTGTIGIILRATRNGSLTKTDAIAKINFLVNETPFRLSTSMYSQIIAELDK
jgi:predicted nucleic acid-binding protein